MNKIINHLKKDKTLKKIIVDYGELEERKLNLNNLFSDIVESIISQQLSTKVADIINGRLHKLARGKFTPDKILKLKDIDIRNCGISYSKIKYIKDLASKVKTKELDLNNLTNLENEEIITELTKVKGIGRWTAEMILMFTLEREDVFSLGDLGLRTAVSKLYNIDRNNLEEIEKISLNWSPYRTYASRYLWKSLNNK